ncbi:hypothetical protein K2X92_02365 [Candidatus Gracilibacteria bacterium]|nr:hypothetical protein [Candidatus Gracilibacteria bacterium]
MKLYHVLFLICCLLISEQIFASLITINGQGGRSSYWSDEPSRFEKTTVGDTCGKITHAQSFLPEYQNCSSGYQIQSNILRKESFRENFKSLKTEYSKASSCNDLCKAFRNANIQDIDNFLNNSSMNSQKKIDSLGVYFEVIMKSLDFFKIDGNGSDPDEYMYSVPFRKKIILQRQNDGAIMGIFRTMDYGMGEDVGPKIIPQYFIFRFRIDGNTILFQEAELTAWAEVSNNSMTSFESNVIKAVKNGWKFQSADFKKRFAYIQNGLYNHQIALTKQYPNKILKQNEWKIEDNVVKYYWGQMGTNWFTTDIDPNTFNINRCTDRYGAIFDGTRITTNTDWYCMDYKIYKNDVTGQIATYSNNSLKLTVIEGVDIDTFQIVKNGYKSFSDTNSVCSSFSSSDIYYTAFDKNYCYAASCNQCDVDKVGKRK